jgi:hypothetical protein
MLLPVDPENIDWTRIRQELEGALRGNAGWSLDDQQLVFGSIWNGIFPEFSKKKRYGMVKDAAPTDPVTFAMITTKEPFGKPDQWLVLDGGSMPEECWLLKVERVLERCQVAKFYRYFKLLPEPHLSRARLHFGLP